MDHEDSAHLRLNSAPAPEDLSWENSLVRWSLALLAIGALWRITRFALCMPLWGDEAYVALNVMNRSLGELTSPLDYMQVSPIGFLFAEWFFVRLFGFSEYAFRFLPLVAGIATTLFYWRWCRLFSSDRTVALAIGFFVVGYYPVRHSTEIKPYAFDQLASIVLLLLTTHVLTKPNDRRRWTLFAGALVLGIVCSYPAVFTAGGCLLALTVDAIARKRHDVWIPLLLVGTAAGCAFVGTQGLVGNSQYAHTGAPMREYWREAFPPHEAWPATKWLIATHTGNLFAYPTGGKNGGSTMTFVLFSVGAVAFWRAWPAGVRWLFFTPFALTFVASAIHRYPYGGSARVAQHLAPIIALCAASGFDVILRRCCRSKGRQRQIVFATLVLFTIFALAGLARDIVAPYKAQTDKEARVLVKEIQETAQRDGLHIVVAQPMSGVPVNQQYYLRIGKEPVSWNGQQNVAWHGLDAKGVVWLNFDPQSRHIAPPLPKNTRWKLSAEQIATIRLDPVMIPFWQIQYWRKAGS